MRTWSQTRLAYAAGVVGLALAGIALAGEVGKHAGLPQRMTAVEVSARTLADGQIEHGRRIDGLSTELGGLRKDLEASTRRSEGSFAEVMKQLAQISGTLNDVRESTRDNQREIVYVKEKANNAAVLADEAMRAAMEGKKP